MLIILSPAKTQDFSPSLQIYQPTLPRLLDHSFKLVDQLKKLGSHDLAKLMDVSNKIAELNFLRYQQFTREFTKDNSKPAICVFKGDVYTSLELEKYNNSQFEFLQTHFRVLSGLYGVLRPFDLIKPYRLEMKTPLITSLEKNLYKFWGSALTNLINQDIKEANHKYLINLASNEYFAAINPKLINVPIINIFFKETKDGAHRTIALNSKRARSLMSNFIIKKQINNPMELKKFAEKGYTYNKELSSEREFLFIK